MIAARNTKTRSKCWFWFAPMIVICALVMGCAASLTVATGAPVPIEHSEYLAVDNAKLFLMTCGADRRAPVLLWLHGGPGGAERPLFRYFNGDLEDNFVVAYWDQRGAGRSFDLDADPHSLTIARHLADLDVVVDHLRQSLGQGKIVLIGHSWGTALGLLYAQAHPDKVSAFIGVAQVVSTREGQQAQYDFALDEASRRKDTDALARLRAIGPPPHKTATQVLAMETLAERYGGVFHKEPHRMWTLVHGMLRGLVTPWEIPSFIRANNVSLEAMNEELLGLDLARSVSSINVPVFFFLGRHDRHVEATLAATYFGALRAPVKRLIWFENSAHNVPFEEPDLFNATVTSTLQSIGIRLEGQPMKPRGDGRLPADREIGAELVFFAASGRP